MPKTKPGYYAVRTGHKPGIYNTWEECQEQVCKYPMSRYKKFSTLKEAQDFLSGIDNNNNEREQGLEFSNIKSVSQSKKFSYIPASSQIYQDSNFTGNSSKLSVRGVNDSKLVVWTDGCSLNNGKCGARAGVGVFWGDNHPGNLSERLPGDKQTNNRAEITAVIRALETCPNRELPLEIKTDSRYTINAYESWIPRWIRNGWQTANNKPVENKDLFVHLNELIKARPGEVSFTYVPGHVGIPGNEAADRLANLGALKECVDTVEPVPLTNFTEDDFFSSEELADIAAEIHSLRYY